VVSRSLAAAVVDEQPRPTRRRRPITSERIACWAFAAYVAAAVPVLLVLGRDRWFAGGDEWDFLAARSLDLGDLFRSHNSHWSTVPILVFKALYAVVGVRSYWPYQLLAIASYLTVCVLVRVIMRRAMVGPWIATALASVLVLFGPGRDDILWAFQIGFTGAAALALTQFILADHPGPIDRRDWLGLGAGALALMCSGQAPPIIVATGIAVLLTRGWKPAALQVVPLGIAYIVWYEAVDASLAGVLAQQGLPATVPRLTFSAFVNWMVSAGRGLMTALGHFAAIAIAMVVVLVGGWALALATRGRERLRREAVAPGALLIGAIVGAAATAPDRFFLGPDIAGSSRYVAMTAALSMPAFGYAVTVIAARWRWAVVPLVAVFLVPIPWHVAAFDDPSARTAASYEQLESVVADLPLMPQLGQLPRSYEPDPAVTELPGVDVGWLLDAEQAGKLPPAVTASPELAAQLTVMVGIESLPDRSPPPGSSCAIERAPIAMTPAVGTQWLVQGTVEVAAAVAGRPVGPTMSYTGVGRGTLLQIEQPDLDLVLSPMPGGHSYRLCR
jgi:hypothetical protein